MRADLQPSGSDIPASPAHILIVDDNAAKRLSLKAVLEPLGHEIVEADSGLNALRRIMAQDFAVILLDVRMPVMDGFQTAALIRERRQSEWTPIIFITAHGSDEVASFEGYAQGAVDFIFAPVVPEELRAKVSVFVKLHMKAEDLAARAQVVQKSADQLRLLTDAAPIGIFQTDAQNHYVYTNPRWSEITGITAPEASGRSWDSIIDAEQRALVAQAGGPIDQVELCHRFEIRVEGSPPRTVLATSKRVPDRDGGVAGWVGTLADVTAEAGAEVAMSAARDQATEASRQKSDFLANMSHEIRTPMNGVIGMTDLLLETELDARQRDYAQTVRNSGEALLTIINDILDFSKVESGTVVIEEVEFNLRVLLDDVVNLLAGAGQAKGVELIADVESTVPAVVGGDPGRARQVLINLIGNAVKFTQAGEVVVRVKEVAFPEEFSTVAGANTAIRFEVSDTGDGIAPAKLGLIFQPFVQADSSTSRKYGGTGLGLAISSQLVALMGGECGVTSTVGSGSEFWFTICVHAKAGQARDVLLAPDEAFSGVPVLVVDDNATQRALLSRHLSEWGMSVTAVGSGAAALDALRAATAAETPYAVAVIDRFMPGMDGLELRNAIVAEPVLETRLILMTGLGQDPADTPAETGICASLSKPVHLEDLLQCLRIALALETAREVPDAEAHHPSSRRRSSGRLLLAEDNLINQKVAVAMLSGAGYSVDTVLSGAAAVKASAAEAYDAILMDCQMPDLNGYEATAAIRAREGSGRRTPIIAMTAGARREDRDRCLAEGMDSYVSKPVSKDALLALVARSVKNGRHAVT